MDYKKIRVVEANAIEVREDQLLILTSDDTRVRNGGELKEKAIYLPEYTERGAKIAEWIIARDSAGNLCAVPLAFKIEK